MAQKNTIDKLFSDVFAGAPLIHLSNGRYGCQGKDKRVVEFSSGYPVGVLVRDGDILCWPLQGLNIMARIITLPGAHLSHSKA